MTDKLTAQEARDLADQLGTDLYRAQDALAFVGECCDIADREQRPITTADVREWLKGARCGRQLAADEPDITGFVIDPAAPPLEFVTWSGPVDHHVTARPVDPEMERAATERAEQAAAKHERAAEQLAALNPPGSTMEQLPAHVLALLPTHPYLSTACQTAGACETAAGTHPTERPWLAAHAEELHARCRLNQKFTGQLCTCGCHATPAPAGTEAADTTKEN